MRGLHREKKSSPSPVRPDELRPHRRSAARCEIEVSGRKSWPHVLSPRGEAEVGSRVDVRSELLMDQTLRRVAVIGGVRIPFCRSNTLYADKSNLEMLTAVLNGLVDKYDLKGVHIGEAIGGAVVSHSKDWNLAREAVLGTRLAPTTPGITIQQACGTSLQAASMIQAKIATGEIECGIAMGSDTTSDAPIVFREKFAHRLVEVQNAKTLGQRLGAFKGFSPGELAPQAPSVGEPRTGLSMGQHAELMAQEWKISRAE